MSTQILLVLFRDAKHYDVSVIITHMRPKLRWYGQLLKNKNFFILKVIFFFKKQLFLIRNFENRMNDNCDIM